MLLRHKVPTIFNIYMLDVICCALGCVILLWQVAHQEAEMQTDDARQQSAAAISARQQYEKAQKGLLSASSDVLTLQALLADWQKKHQGLVLSLAATEKERDDARQIAAIRQQSLVETRGNLNLREDQLKKLQEDLEKLLASNKKTSAELTGTLKLNADLLARIATMKTDIARKQLEIDLFNKKLQEQAVLLKLSADDARKLQRLLDALRDDHKDAQAKLKLTELQLKVREQDLDKSRTELATLLALKDRAAKDLTLGAKDLADARKQLAALLAERTEWKDKLAKYQATATLDKDTLNKRIAALQAEADQRFAGIPLTGENVIFLIDISGSMAMKDETTDDPDKWPFLCETLMKLMRSIPTLQRFQVILFSDKTHYLFENRDIWLKYEGVETAKMTRDALRKVKVEGGTNMHDAFDEAFRYRKIKLDTIYLFSDGLPNIGPGVPVSGAKPTEEQRNYFMGKFVRDKLKTGWNAAQAGQKDVRINAVGFFFESPDVGAFLWAMAREHRGSFVGLR